MENEAEEVDIEVVKKKEFKISCCRSYMTPKGRCYTCPDQEVDTDIDEGDW